MATGLLSVKFKKLPVLSWPGATARYSSLTTPVETSTAPDLKQEGKVKKCGILGVQCTPKMFYCESFAFKANNHSNASGSPLAGQPPLMQINPHARQELS